MTTTSQPTPSGLVLVTYGGEPTGPVEANATTNIKTVFDASSGTATTADRLVSLKTFNDEAVLQFTKDAKATEAWLDTYESVLHRIDQHSSAVASKSLFTDRVSRYLNAEQDMFLSISELAAKLLYQSCFSKNDVDPASTSEIDEDDIEVKVDFRAHYLEKLRYEAIINDILLNNHFKGPSYYLDQKGGLVVDYFRGNDRITLVFGDESAQLLTHVKGEFLHKLFSPAQSSRIAVRDFLDGLLVGTD